MDDSPETRYAQSGDLKIGYQVLGAGPIDLVFVPGLLSHMDFLWGLPTAVRFFRRLATFARVVVYDKRGQGVSDPPPGIPTLEEDMQDLNAVLDAVESRHPALFAYSEGSPMCALFAATYPDRVTALVLFGAYVSGATWRAHTEARGETAYSELEAMLEHWGEGRGLEVFAPSVVSPDRLRRFGVFERAVASPALIRARWEMILRVDVTPVLAALQAPVLVLQRTGDRAVPPAAAREVAEAIPGARYVELAGVDHIPWVGETGELLDEVEEFLTGARHAADPDRVLATVLFTDIVDSTRRAAEVGDRRWRALIEAHEQLVRGLLDDYRGNEVKTMGDGFLATFDGPARAINCASAVARETAALGLEVRAGVHTGECELIDHDVRGMAVNIGARVVARAAPGEVLVSGTVKDLVVGSGIGFEDRGIHELKGVPGEWHLFAVGDGEGR